jgi:membrane protease subunit HflK
MPSAPIREWLTGGAWRRPWLRWAAAGVVVAAWAATGFYTVDSRERAVVERFGAAVRQEGPGIHVAAPWPIERIQTVKVNEVKRLEVGFRFLGELFEDSEGLRRTDTLTGDANILKIMMVVQYKVRDPIDYLFHVAQPHWLVERASEAALSATVASMAVDDVLTRSKAEIQQRALERAQRSLDRYGAGVRLLGANLAVVSPPVPVIEAFNDVARAKKDRERRIDDARSYANEVLPGARAEASELVSKARARREERVSRAHADAHRFERLLDAYRREPNLTRRRLYLSTVEKVLRRSRVVVGDRESEVTLWE